MKIIREPLFHFLLAGAALFVLFSVVNKDRPGFGNSDSEIVISEGRINSITQKFAKVWQRPPTKGELDGLIQAYVREEVLYREALIMGLDVGDEVVRRRMAQKLEFVSEDIASLQGPTENELKTYLESHTEDFRQDTRLSFQHVYLNSEKRGKSTRKDAESILAKLRGIGGSHKYIDLGDPSMLSSEFASTNQTEIASLFGKEFTSQLISQEIKKWSGPIESAYGLHLVFISEKIDGTIPQLEDVRNDVIREWTFVNKEENRKIFYETLLERYTVTIEKPIDDSADLAQLNDGATK